MLFIQRIVNQTKLRGERRGRSAGIEIIISKIIKKKKGGKSLLDEIEIYVSHPRRFISRRTTWQFSRRLCTLPGESCFRFGPRTHPNNLVTFARVHSHPHTDTRACIQYRLSSLPRSNISTNIYNNIDLQLFHQPPSAFLFLLSTSASMFHPRRGPRIVNTYDVSSKTFIDPVQDVTHILDTLQ